MIDLDALLRPIQPDRPAGGDLRLDERDTSFATVRENRRQDDPALVPAGVEPKTANWKLVADTCTTALTRSTKDLELACYLTEAATRLQGFDGLAQGLRLVTQLVACFWDSLHPGREDDEVIIELRSKWLNWLGSAHEFLESVRAVPLTTALEADPLTLRHCLEAQAMADASRTNRPVYEEMVQSGKTTPEQWSRAFRATPLDQQQATRSGAAAAMAALAELAAASEQHLTGDDAPSFTRLRETLEQVLEIYQLPEAGADADTDAAAGGAPAGGGGGAPAQAGGPLRSRQDVIRSLTEVVLFLRASEPHSPVSYLLERAIRWLNMSFDELLRDIVKAEDTIAHVRETLGLGQNGGSDEG